VWTRDGIPARLHNTLREQVRQLEGRTPDPTAAPMSVRATETVT
jgi:hypothetical protein